MIANAAVIAAKRPASASFSACRLASASFFLLGAATFVDFGAPIGRLVSPLPFCCDELLLVRVCIPLPGTSRCCSSTIVPEAFSRNSPPSTGLLPPGPKFDRGSPRKFEENSSSGWSSVLDIYKIRKSGNEVYLQLQQQAEIPKNHKLKTQK
jgi:hypothetical protein